jgi:hypothetical protein
MKLHYPSPRAFVRGYTVVAALACGIAVTVIVHDAPAANAEDHREKQAQAWSEQVARGQRSVTVATESRARLRLLYNQLVRSSAARYAADHP